jgi:pre-rRNA-processing protein IPI1
MGKAKKTKQKDFVKKKLKVGKSKQPASNATNLSFQSKQIRINEQVIFDNQTVFEDKNLSKHFLMEKLGQLSNNSDSVRSGTSLRNQCSSSFFRCSKLYKDCI